jgi:glycosyltransferase involved in cell wall biosynthesis
VLTSARRAVAYRDPWDVPLEARRRRLLAGSPRVAYYYTVPDTSTFRYRVFNMVEALAHAEPTASATWITADDGAGAIELIEHVDLLVVCRALYSAHVAAVITRAKALGIRVLFDVDDLIFDDRYAHLIMETLDQVVDEDGLQFWFGRISRCGATMRLCDGAITTNKLLAEGIRDYADLPTWVVPNFLNRAQLEVSSQVRESKQDGPRAGDRIRLGYFSGTPTHNRDFAIVEPALAGLLDEDPRLEVLVVGFLPATNRLAPLGDRVTVLPLLDFLNLQVAIADADLNLAPLQHNAFTNCKSELKYFEAAVVGTATVASPTFTLAGAITHGDNGYLARAHEWYGVLREAIERIDDLPRVADRAASAALARYVPEAQAAALRAALFG